MTVTAFQPNAFQQNAFQIVSGGSGSSDRFAYVPWSVPRPQPRRRKRRIVAPSAVPAPQQPAVPDLPPPRPAISARPPPALPQPGLAGVDHDMADALDVSDAMKIIRMLAESGEL